ncbi:MAG: HNH endonuclease signature motif containing protein [Patescibacteria group bacterium]
MQCHIHDNVPASADLLVIHHIKPQAFGGQDIPENRVMLCASCHDVLHKAEHKLSKGKTGEALDIIDRFLPNQTARQQRLRALMNSVASARKAWKTKSNVVPEAQGKVDDTVIVQLNLPIWLHHRLKTTAQDQQVGLYKLCLRVLEQYVVKQDMPTLDPAIPAAPAPEVKFIAPKPNKIIQIWNVLDKADAMELETRMLSAGSKERYCEIMQKALKLSPLPRHLEDKDFSLDDAFGLLTCVFDKLKKAQMRGVDELYCGVLLLALKGYPVTLQIQAEAQHYKTTKWLLHLFPAA